MGFSCRYTHSLFAYSDILYISVKLNNILNQSRTLAYQLYRSIHTYLLFYEGDCENVCQGTDVIAIGAMFHRSESDKTNAFYHCEITNCYTVCFIV